MPGWRWRTWATGARGPAGARERERTAVLRWLGGRLPDLDTHGALFEVGKRERA